MSDNVTLNTNSTSGAVLATDDVSSVHYQKVKLDIGADGVASGTAGVVGNPIFVRLSDGSSAVSPATQTTLASLLTAAQAIQTAIELIDNTVGGTELQVDIVGSLPAGTNAIGKLSANNGVDIGDVDVTSVIPGTGATNLGKAIDTAAGATDTGIAPLAVRDDALSSLTPVEGDFVPLRTDSTGALWVATDDTIAVSNAGLTALNGAISGTEVQVDVLTMPTVTVNSHAVTNAGTFAVQVDGAALTALQLIDDPVFADDAAFTVGTSKVQAIGFLADETATDSVDEGDVGAARMTLDRKLQTATEHESNSMRASGTSVTPKFAAIDCASSGDNTIVAAVASKKIRVLSLVLVAAGTTTVRFESGAGGTALTGQLSLVANTGFSIGYSPVGHFETASNTLLNLELSAAVSVDGWLTYIEV